MSNILVMSSKNSCKFVAESACIFLVLLCVLLPIGWNQIAIAGLYDEMKYQASPDQVLVLYNTDWDVNAAGSTGRQDSKEVAEYYQVMHADSNSRKMPYLLGVTCRHKDKHLNQGIIREDSADNKNGIFYKGSGRPPEDLEWVRDSAMVELFIADPETDWDSVLIRVSSELTGEMKTIYSQGQSSEEIPLLITGLPKNVRWQREYHPLKDGEGRCYRFDASKHFSGNIIVSISSKKLSGTSNTDLFLRYFDKKDFHFVPFGMDGIPDDKNLEEDVLTPVRNFLENPKNVLGDGTLLKDHILYMVLVHGMPYAANGVFGIEHGATSRKGDHGSLVSLEQRLQTLYFDWEKYYRPSLTTAFMRGGPDSKKGVGNHIVTTAMRFPLIGTRWNSSLHPDTYSSLRHNNKKNPNFYPVAPFFERRSRLAEHKRLYSVMRIDGQSVEDAKRIIDYSIYASRYLRPEMDCYVRNALKMQKRDYIDNLPERLLTADRENLWGRKELEKLGFRIISNDVQGLPFMVMNSGATSGNCSLETPDWTESGFYPGGMHRIGRSENGWNKKNGQIHQMLMMGVSVSACGAPAYDGGPHITNTTFWDNRIVMKYLFRGKDLGESMLLSNYHTNWSTSYVGDPLMHPDLTTTEIDVVPPEALNGEVSVRFIQKDDDYDCVFGTVIGHAHIIPEVAVMRIGCSNESGEEISGYSPRFSRRPSATISGFKSNVKYSCKVFLADPYENHSPYYSINFHTPKITLSE